ncbi:putative ATPase [Nonomuraea thailandensis]|uniref:ATPase n=1 Tax=Nonomuraea thailandensis TaxID=1188745 RepID=A0A9X2G8J9_9ACTN|nr:NB-ARC domain-containing protein [Nonomuraea thailandensis]MCP2353030.1 putative ATPase [Nonomuraea thailandensis]
MRWLDRHEGNLPHQAPELIGRSEICARVARAIGQSRLVTLHGPGGMGKTSIALHVADALRQDFPDGVWLVQLSALDNSAVVPSAVIEAFALADVSARPERDVLTEYLHQRTLLLVLDTCEHLQPAIADVARTLLDAAPGVRILATSRVPLDLEAEHLITIEPMRTEGTAGAGQRGGGEALELFVARARQAGVHLDPSSMPAAQEVCRRLDGIPLALELAAASLPHLPLQELLAQIGHGGSLSTTDRDVTHRHHTLHTAFGWSHRLCVPSERLLWARLSVFAGGFDVGAAQEVCDDGYLAMPVAEVLGELVRKSILRQNADGRFEMLDTVRDYGAMWLRELGEHDAFHRRHRDYYLHLARQGEGAWSGAGQVHWFQRMRAELSNVRAAVDWSLAHPEEAAAGLELVSSLWWLWVACGFSAEGRLHLQHALKVNTTPSATRCAVLWTEAYLANAQGDLSRARAAATLCRQEAIAIGYPEGVVVATKMLGTAALLAGDLELAGHQLGQALEYLRGDPRHLNPGLLPAVVELALSLIMRGRPQTALPLLDECLRHCQATGELWLRSYALYVRAIGCRALERIDDAIDALHAALRIKRHFRDVLGIVLCMEALSQLVIQAGHPPSTAAVLQGAADVSWREYGLPMMGSPYFADDHARCTEAVKNLIGEQAYQRAFTFGASLSLTDGIGYALGEAGAPAAVDVLDLIAR